MSDRVTFSFSKWWLYRIGGALGILAISAATDFWPIMWERLIVQTFGLTQNPILAYQGLIGGVLAFIGGGIAAWMILLQIKESREQHDQLIKAERQIQLNLKRGIFTAIEAEMSMFSSQLSEAQYVLRLYLRNEYLLMHNPEHEAKLRPHKTKFRDYAWDNSRFLDYQMILDLMEFVKLLTEYREITMSDTKETSRISNLNKKQIQEAIVQIELIGDKLLEIARNASAQRIALEKEVEKYSSATSIEQHSKF